MSKKVYFFTIDLFETMGDVKRDYKEIKTFLQQIINDNAVKTSISQKDCYVLDLTMGDELHYTADIFKYAETSLFMRVSSQKPTGAYIHRNYDTNIPASLLHGKSEEKEGIEVYTYIYCDYETGMVAIVNQQSAPSQRILNTIFQKYNPNYYLKLLPIANANGIDRIYNATEPCISQIEVEVPVPSAEVLESLFHWKNKDVLDIQGKNLKAVVKVTSADRKTITTEETESRSIINNMKDSITQYRKARVRAKAAGVKTQDYNFFDENFSYPIDIPTYEPRSGSKHYFTVDELTDIYKDHLIMAFNENKATLKSIADR